MDERENEKYKDKFVLPKHIGDMLKKDKKVIVIKNGVAQIDKTHPDYDFLMED